MKHTALVLALTLLAGCATTFRPWMLSDVKEGMDRSQVTHLLGEPDSTEMKNGAELLYYNYREDYNPPPAGDTLYTSDTSRSIERQQVKRGLKEYTYVVKLVDGKVQSYKELTD